MSGFWTVATTVIGSRGISHPTNCNSDTQLPPMLPSLDDDAARLQFIEHVRSYYDANTKKFERLGQGAAFVHRGVWALSVKMPHEAFCYVENLLLENLPSRDLPVVLDLGCGLGASLMYLARRRPIIGKGITISPTQARRAQELIAGAALDKNVECRIGNFLSLPEDWTHVDLAFSIEAFVHGPDPVKYFSEVARVLRPGGRLAICDDFLTAEAKASSSRRTNRWIEDFRRGWRIGSLITAEQAGEMAEGVGLKPLSASDLTPYLRLGGLRNRFLRLAADLARLIPVARAAPYWGSLIGGAALQRGQRSGVLAYRLLVFEKPEA
jgi:cyclopropane fatty-acyl-phospholipid synthase-like methyltransferase